MNFKRGVAEWVESDTTDPGHQIMEDDEIVADILEDDNSDEHEEEGTVEDSHLVTPRWFPMH